MSGYVILNTKGANVDNSTRDPMALPKKDEGVVIWGPVVNNKLSDDPTVGEIERVNRFKGLGNLLALDPTEVAENHHNMMGIADNVDALERIDNTEKPAFLTDIRNAKRMPIMNIRHRRYDYSNMNKFFGHVLKTYGAWHMHESIEEAEEKYANALKTWNDNKFTPTMAKNARYTAYETEMGNQLANIWHPLFALNATRNLTPINTSPSDWWSQGEMGDVFSEAIWKKNEFLINIHGQFDPNSSRRFIAIGGPENFDPNWFDANAARLNELHETTDYKSLSLSNEAWNWENFMQENDPKPTMPNYSTVKKGLASFVIANLCAFGIGTLAGIFGSLRKKDRGSGSALSFTSTAGLIKHASPFLVVTPSDSAIMSWIKSSAQQYDGYTNVMTMWKGAATSVGTLWDKVGEIFGVDPQNSTLGSQNQVNDPSEVIGVTLDENVTLTNGQPVDFEVPEKDGVKLYTPFKLASGVTRNDGSVGSSGYVVITVVGEGYFKKVRVGRKTYKGKSAHVIAKVNGQKIGVANLLSNAEKLRVQYSKTACHGLYENTRAIKENLSNYVAVVEKYKSQATGAPVNREIRNAQAQGKKVRLGLQEGAYYEKGDIVFTHGTINNAAYANGSQAEEYYFIVQKSGTYEPNKVSGNEKVHHPWHTSATNQQAIDFWKDPNTGVSSARYAALGSKALALTGARGPWWRLRSPYKPVDEQDLELSIGGIFYLGNVTRIDQNEDVKMYLDWLKYLSYRADLESTRLSNCLAMSGGRYNIHFSSMSQSGKIIVDTTVTNKTHKLGASYQVMLDVKGQPVINMIDGGQGYGNVTASFGLPNEAQNNSIFTTGGVDCYGKHSDGTDAYWYFYNRKRQKPFRVKDIFVSVAHARGEIRRLDDFVANIPVGEESTSIGCEDLTSSWSTYNVYPSTLTVKLAPTTTIEPFFEVSPVISIQNHGDSIPASLQGLFVASNLTLQTMVQGPNKTMQDLKAAQLNDSEQLKLAWKNLFDAFHTFLQSTLINELSQNLQKTTSVRVVNGKPENDNASGPPILWKQDSIDGVKYNLHEFIIRAIKQINIPQSDADKLQEWTSYDAVFGLCSSGEIDEIGKELSETFFANKESFTIHQKNNTIKESLCGKKSCGAAHAYTTVPPLGNTVGTIEEIIRDSSIQDAKLTLVGTSPLEASLDVQGVEASLSDVYTVGNTITLRTDGDEKRAGDESITVRGSVKSYTRESDNNYKLIFFPTTLEMDFGAGTGRQEVTFTSGHFSNSQLQNATGWHVLFNKPGSLLYKTKNVEIKDAPLNICGNAEVTVKFFPTWSSEQVVSATESILWQNYNSLAAESQQLLGRITFDLKFQDKKLGNNNGAVVSKNYVMKEGNISTHKSVAVPILEKLASSVMKDLDGVTYHWSLADTSLPPIWGNYYGFASTLSTQMLGVLKMPYLLGGNTVGSVLQATTEVLTRKSFKPDLSIISREPFVDKGEGVIGSIWKALFGGGSEDPIYNPTNVDHYITHMRIAYEGHRVLSLGWMPYGDRIVKQTAGAGQSNEAAGASAVSKSDTFHTLTKSNIERFYKQHTINIYKGFWRDLKTANKNTEANVHPTKHMTLGSVVREGAVDGILYIDDNSNPYWENLGLNKASSANTPLQATQRLSGICFPVIKSTGIQWKNFIAGVSGKLPLYQPSGQQRETRLGFSAPHSIWTNNKMPDSLQEYVDIANPVTSPDSSPTDYHGWQDKTVDSTRFKLGLITKSPTDVSYQGYGDNSQNTFNTSDVVKEYQDISFYKEDRRGQGIKQIDNLYDATEEIINPYIDDSTTPTDSNGVAFGNGEWESAGEWGAKTKASNGNINSTFTNSPSRLTAWAEKEGEVPVNSVRETFPGNGEWEVLGQELDEEFGKFAPVFSKIYIDDIGINVEKDNDADKFLVGDNPVNEKWSDDYGHGHSKAVVDFHRFYDKYVYHDWKTTQNNVTQHNWEKNNNYWSAWHAAYEEGIKGAYIISGTGYNSAEALASMSGQLMVYKEVVNKFHFTGEAPTVGSDQQQKRVLTDKATEAEKASFVGTGYAHTLADAYALASDHLNYIVRTWVETNYTTEEKARLCDSVSPCPCINVRSGYLTKTGTDSNGNPIFKTEELAESNLQNQPAANLQEVITLAKSNGAAGSQCHYQITNGECKWNIPLANGTNIAGTPWSGDWDTGQANVCVKDLLHGYDGDAVTLYALGCKSNSSDSDDVTKASAVEALKIKIASEENDHCNNAGYGVGWLDGADKMKADGSQQTWSGNNQDDPNVFGKYDSTTISQDQTKYPHWVDGVNWYDWLTRAGQDGKTFTTNNPEYANSTATYIEITGNNLSSQDFFDKAKLLWNVYTLNQGYAHAYPGSCTTPSTGVMEGPHQSLVAGFGFVIGGNASSQSYNEHSYFRGFSDGPSTNSWNDLMSASMNSEPSPGTDFHDFFRDYVTDSDGQGLAGCSNFVYDNPDGSYSATWLPVGDIDHDVFGNLAGSNDNERSQSVRSWGQGNISDYFGAQYDDVEVDYGWRVDEFGTKLKAKYRGYGFTGCPCEDFVTNWAATARAEAFETLHYWFKNEQGDTNPVKSFLGSDNCAEKYDENHARFEATWENEIADGLVDSSTFGSVIQKPSCLHGGYDDGDGDNEISSPYQHSNIGMSDFPSYYNQMSPNPGNNCGHTEAGDHDCALTALCGAGANNLGNNPEQNIYYLGPDAQVATSAGHYGSDPSLGHPIKMWPINNTANFKDLPNGYKCYSRSLNESRSLTKKDGTSVNKTLNLKEIIVSGSAVDPNGTTRYGIIAHEFWGTLTTPGSVDDNTTYDYVRIPVNNADDWLLKNQAKKAAVDTEVYEVRLTGDAYCNYAHHYATAKLYSTSYSGQLYGSGVSPWITGVTDWTSKGVVAAQSAQGSKPVINSFEENYLLKYDGDTKGIETFVTNSPAGPKAVPSRVVGGVNEARARGESVLPNVNNPAAPAKPTTTGSTQSLIVGYNKADTAGTRGQNEIKDHNGVATYSDEPYAKAGGDKIFIGGWEIHNQAMDHTVIGQEFNTQKQAGRDVGTAFIGKKVIIFDPEFDTSKYKRTTGKGKNQLNHAALNKAYREYSVTVNTNNNTTQTFTEGDIEKVFGDQQAYLNYVKASQIKQNVIVNSYGTINSLDNKSKNAQKNPFDGLYTILEGNLAACPHCQSNVIEEGQEYTAAQKDVMYFNESYIMGTKVQWEIYSGNYHFAVPFRTYESIVDNPRKPNTTNKTNKIKAGHWQEGLRPEDKDNKDPRLARTQYALATHTYGNPYPSTLGCESYGEGTNNKLVEYTMVNDRQWLEIPSGGLMEIANNPMMGEPVWAGPKAPEICECRNADNSVQATYTNPTAADKTACTSVAGRTWHCMDWDNHPGNKWTQLGGYYEKTAPNNQFPYQHSINLYKGSQKTNESIEDTNPPSYS